MSSRQPVQATDDPAITPEMVNAIKWHHRILLPGGIVTPGRDDSTKKLRRLQLPARLDGKSVLDIGAWDGFFSFECERRGASRVVAYDDFVWNRTDDGFTGKRGFELARRALRSRVVDVEGAIYDLGPDRVGGRFDVVLFLGVLYHLRHPLLALEKVRSVLAPGGLVIVETHAALMGTRQPALAFYPGGELNADDTNWFAPNAAGLIGLMSAAGFREARITWQPGLAFRIGRAFKYAWREKHPLFRSMGEGRLYAHATA